MNALPVSHPHHSSPHTNILASLVKGEVLSLEKIRATTGGIVLRSHNPLKTTSSLAPHHVLASLVKGEVLSPEKIRATTGGIATPQPCPAPTPLPPLEKGEVA